MNKAKLFGCLTLVVAIMMISIGFVMESNNMLTSEALNMKSAVASAISVKEGNKEVVEPTELTTDIEMETAPAAYIKIEKVSKNNISGI